MKTLKSIRKSNAVFLAVAVALFFCAFFTHKSCAADASVSATLSDDTTEVGEPVDLTIEITGAGGGQIPRRIDVDGLDISFNGQQHKVQWVNGVTTQSVSCVYSVQPQRAGKFTIPAITV